MTADDNRSRPYRQQLSAQVPSPLRENELRIPLSCLNYRVLETN